jgi:hypothetical protein
VVLSQVLFSTRFALVYYSPLLAVARCQWPFVSKGRLTVVAHGQRQSQEFLETMWYLPWTMWHCVACGEVHWGDAGGI